MATRTHDRSTNRPDIVDLFATNNTDMLFRQLLFSTVEHDVADTEQTLSTDQEDAVSNWPSARFSPA